MTEETNQTSAKSERRVARAHRILDAASSLILRWGYNKTTIDDVARQAGVAKGTIYLHWNTRDELFAALIHRERLAMSADLRARIAADPAGGTLHGVLKHSALALMQRPLLKALLLGDPAIVGKLASSEHSSAAFAERMGGFGVYLAFLRERGLLRADLSAEQQLLVFSAIFAGFFLAAPLLPPELRRPDEEVAGLMALTAQRVLEPDRALADAELRELQQSFLGYIDRATARAEERLREELG